MADPDRPKSTADEPGLTAQQKAREQRLAQALRQNLRRRKAPAAKSSGGADEGP